MSYPVVIDHVPPSSPRNRLTTLLRGFLALPHVLLVGGMGVSMAYGQRTQVSAGAEGGLLGAVAVLGAFVSWCTIVVAGTQIDAVRRYTLFYLRWRTRALAYLMLLQDAHPPFGDGPYPVTCTVQVPATRRRLTVLVRILLAVPHLVVLVLLWFAWCLATMIAWVAILVTGRHPQALYDFGAGVLRWRLRVDAYLLLLVDDYPPFSLG